MKKGWKIGFIVLCVLLAASLCANAYFLFWSNDTNVCYLQSTDEIKIMETGILKDLEKFSQGEDIAFTYDFENEALAQLRDKYDIEKIAGTGSESERAFRLMDEFAPRLTHESNLTAELEMKALPLLEYSLDNRSHGINCRCKAQILNEMCLSLGIYSRKLWINPISPYDSDCHVVNEVWDSSLGKWIMLDITNNEYWIDENGTPLSVLEIRKKGANNEFCTPARPGNDTSKPEKLYDRYLADYLYIMKNMAYTYYCVECTVGESNPKYMLKPEMLNSNYEYLISEKSIEAAPF